MAFVSPKECMPNVDTNAEDFQGKLLSTIARAKEEGRLILTQEEVNECNRIKNEWISDTAQKAAEDLQSSTEILPSDSPDTASAKMETVTAGTCWLESLFTRIKESLNKIFSNLRRNVDWLGEQLAAFFLRFKSFFI